MPWTDFLNPDRMIAAAFKLFLAVFVFMCAMQLLCSALSHLSGFDIAEVFAFWVVLNGVIFSIRQRVASR